MITHIRGLITPIIATQEPPSRSPQEAPKHKLAKVNTPTRGRLQVDSLCLLGLPVGPCPRFSGLGFMSRRFRVQGFRIRCRCGRYPSECRQHWLWPKIAILRLLLGLLVLLVLLVLVVVVVLLLMLLLQSTTTTSTTAATTAASTATTTSTCRHLVSQCDVCSLYLDSVASPQTRSPRIGCKDPARLR